MSLGHSDDTSRRALTTPIAALRCSAPLPLESCPPPNALSQPDHPHLSIQRTWFNPSQPHSPVSGPLRLNIAWPTTATGKTIISKAVQTRANLNLSRITLLPQKPPSALPTLTRPPWLLLLLSHPFTTRAVTARLLQHHPEATLVIRDMRLPTLSTVIRLLAGSSLRLASNSSRISRLCSRSLTRVHRPILLPHRTSEVVTTMIAALPMGKSLTLRIPTTPILTIDNRRLVPHRQMVTRTTVTSLAAFTSTLKLDLATLPN